MSTILLNIKQEVNKSQKVFVAGSVVFILGVILGLFLPSSQTVNDIFGDLAKNYFNSVFSVDASPIKNLFSRILTNALLIILVALFSLTVYTYFINFIIILYRGFILGLVFVVFIINLGFSGIITYLFLILANNIIVTIAIILFITLIYDSLICKTSNYTAVLIKNAIYSFIVSLIGSVLEFLLLTCLIRPLNLYF